MSAAAATALSGCSGDSEPDAAPSSSPVGASPSLSPQADSAGTAPRFPGDPGPGRLYLGTSLPISTSAAARPEVGGVAMGMVRRFYRAHQLDLLRDTVASDVQAGILPFVSIKPPAPWDAVAAGQADAWLDRLGEILGGFDSPLFICVQHEPENDVDGDRQVPATYRQMQRRLRRRLRGLDLVTPVPVLMRWTFDERSGRNPEEWLADETVVQGIDVYNEWEGDVSSEWRSFAELWEPVRAQLPLGPVVIPEVGTPTDPQRPRRASRWLQEAVDVASQTDVVGLVWFESDEERRDGKFRLDALGQTTLRRQLSRPEVVRLEDVRP